MLQDDRSLSPNEASNTLLRQLLAGVDPASVRNYSDLVNARFALRRTSSMSMGSTNKPSLLNAHTVVDEEIRPRRSTMFSHLNLPKRNQIDSSIEITRPKRFKESSDLKNCKSNIFSVKQEESDLNLNSNKSDNSITLFNSNEDLLPEMQSKIKKINKEIPSSQDVLQNQMRPRAHTASEMENVINAWSQRFSHKEQLKRFFECMLENSLSNSKCVRSSEFSDSHKTLDYCTTTTSDNFNNIDESTITSPLSQLLESTPPYNPSHQGLLEVSTSNTLRSKNTYQMNKKNVGTASAIIQEKTTAPIVQSRSNAILDLSKTISASETLKSLLENRKFESFTTLNDNEFANNQVLDFSYKDKLPPSSDNSEDSFNLSFLNRTSDLQQLFRCVSFSNENSASYNLIPQSVIHPSTLGNLPSAWPIRLATKTSHLLCRRVGEWLLAADNYTYRICPRIAPNALLATAALNRYCVCSQTKPQPIGEISCVHSIPKISFTLKRMLRKIWPQLLLTSMIRENFSFSISPLSITEVEALEARRNDENGSVSASTGDSDLLIARLGTANALINLIETGNQLLLDTPVLECVRKCVFAQYAYPNYYTVSYSIAIEDLRQCCHRCSGDPTFFSSVLLLMNQMHSISPESIHCLFSIEKLSALFSP